MLGLGLAFGHLLGPRMPPLSHVVAHLTFCYAEMVSALEQGGIGPRRSAGLFR
jgi:hypothetical protein